MHNLEAGNIYTVSPVSTLLQIDNNSYEDHNLQIVIFIAVIAYSVTLPLEAEGYLYILCIIL